MLTIPKCDFRSSSISGVWSFCMISTMNPASTTAQKSRSSSWSNHFDSRSFCVATVWVLPNDEPLFEANFNFDVKNHQCDLLGDGGEVSGLLKELWRGGIMISGESTILCACVPVIENCRCVYISHTTMSLNGQCQVNWEFMGLLSTSLHRSFFAFRYSLFLRRLRKNQFFTLSFSYFFSLSCCALAPRKLLLLSE